MKRRQMTRALAEPMLWGLGEGLSVAEVARGLAIRECTVVEAVEAFGPAWLAQQIRVVWRALYRIDQSRAEKDWAYANWLRARKAATALLDDMGEM